MGAKDYDCVLPIVKFVNSASEQNVDCINLFLVICSTCASRNTVVFDCTYVFCDVDSTGRKNVC